MFAHELQKEVFLGASGFSVDHFEKTYLEIFAGVNADVFLTCNAFALSQAQLKRIRKDAYGRQNDPRHSRAHSAHQATDRHLSSVEIEQNRLRLSHGQRVLYSCRFIRLNCIPDCILQASVSSHQHAALRLAIDSIGTVSQVDAIRCGPGCAGS